MKKLRTLWGQHFLLLELIVSVFAGALFVWWFIRHGGQDLVDSTLDGNRAAVYGALAGIFGSLLGFVITAASIVLGLSGSERLAIIRESDHYETLWKVFMSATRALAIATVASLTALVIDRDKRPCRVVLFVEVLFVILAVFRLARCVWALENVINLVAKPKKKSGNGDGA
jgi:hypothetical protein